MKRLLKLFAILAMLICVLLSKAGATGPEKRLALVIGNSAYKAQPLATTVNDAALISQTLQSAGFDVIGARDLDQNLLREAFRNLTNKIASAGPGAVVFIYFAGYGAQLAGENYLIPIGVEISDVADLPTRAVSLSELKQALSGINSKSTFIVLDAGRPGPFVVAKQAGGLVWTEPEANMLIAFSTAPGTLARDTSGSYGAYARALAEMMREGDLTPTDLFDRVRLRVHELTGGDQIPWDASKIEAPFKFFERAPTVSTRTDTPERAARFRLQPMRALGAQNAYATALMRDTFDAYTDFLADYWQDPMTKRVRALLAARRESITWERTCQTNESAAYWSYLERYPRGPHVADAVRSLTRMGAPTMPPPKFARIDYDIPPPLPDELEYIERPMLILSDPALGFEPPPAISADFIGPPPQELVNLKSSPVSAAHDLPVVNLPLQAFLRLPTEAKASSNSTSETHEAWSMRPAIGVPAGPQKQAGTPSASPILVPDTSDPANAVRPSSLASEGGAQSKDANVRSRNQETTDETTSHVASLSLVTSGAPQQKPPTQLEAVQANGDRSDQGVGSSSSNVTQPIVSTMSSWLTDTVTRWNTNVALSKFLLSSNVQVWGPVSARLALQTWRFEIASLRLNSKTRLRSAHPASLAPSQSRLAAQPSATPISPSHASTSIARPAPRSAALAPFAGGTPSKPSTGQLGLSSTAMDQAGPRKKPPTAKPPPANQPVRDTNEEREAVPADSR